MVLVLIGTNDVLHGVPTNQTVVNLEKIVKVLRQKNPKVTIFMGTLPPASYYRQSLIDLNQEIVRIAERSSTPESRVIVVDQYYGYDGVKDNQPPGYVHPDMSGEKKIAKNWYDAITPYLNGTAPTPTPTSPPDDRADHGPHNGRYPGRDHDGGHGHDRHPAGLGRADQPLRHQALYNRGHGGLFPRGPLHRVRPVLHLGQRLRPLLPREPGERHETAEQDVRPLVPDSALGHGPSLISLFSSSRFDLCFRSEQLRLIPSDTWGRALGSA